MLTGRLSRSEWIAVSGGLLLVLAVFLPWYGTSENPNAEIEGGRGDFSAWQVHPILRWLMLAAAFSPLILAWIVLREHELSWPRGEMTAVVAIAALGLVLYNGIVTRPGEPRAQISLQIGWFLAVIGIVLMVVGGARRATEVERARRPPGVLR
jgi:4-amino-4-deoxy-L-arabinose transferase-like glycosyltransferase